MNQENVGKFIAELRKKKGMTQAQLGEKLGVTNKTVSRWENGNYMPDISIMKPLCEELGINVNELLSGEALEEEEYREKAEENIFYAFNQSKIIRKKRWIDALGGAGTGLLVSALISPDSGRRTAAAVVGIGMICISWCIMWCYDRQVLYLLNRQEKKE